MSGNSRSALTMKPRLPKRCVPCPSSALADVVGDSVATVTPTPIAQPDRRIRRAPARAMPSSPRFLERSSRRRGSPIARARRLAMPRNRPLPWLAPDAPGGISLILCKMPSRSPRVADASRLGELGPRGSRPERWWGRGSRSVRGPLRDHWGLPHFQLRISGMSWPFLSMYCLCSMSLSLSCCFR